MMTLRQKDLSTLLTDGSISACNYDESTIVNNSVHAVNSPPLRSNDDLMNLGLRGKGMHIGHLNVRGLRSKIDQINLLLSSRENSIHILGLSETKLCPEHVTSHFEIPSFQIFRKDYEERSGGLIVYVKEGVKCSRRSDFESKEFDSL